MNSRFLALAPILALLTPAAALADPPTVEFAGYTWQVRDYGGGPGPNNWSPDNVFVDEAGLHLRITSADGKWNAAEVVMTTALGFGTYNFDVAGRPDQLDKNVVLGLFNYPASSEIGPDGTNEIDIEFARWGVGKAKARLNWTVHAPVVSVKPAGQSHTSAIKEEGSVQTFDWTADRITYSWARSGDPKPVASWVYAPKSPERHIPQVPLVVHMNLWLFEGKPPSDGAPVEVVIRDFHFAPHTNRALTNRVNGLSALTSRNHARG